MNYLKSDKARSICVQAALRRGVSAEHAQWFAHALIETSLTGVDTHGLRLLPLYLRELDEGRSNAAPEFKVLRRRGGIATLDADRALGTVAGTHAARLAADLAAEHGIGAVAVGNSNHFGAAAVYGREIAARGMAALVTTSAAARMAPFNGKRPMFGTNPVCFAAPAGEGRNFVLDMATSQISYSQIKHYRKNGIRLPLGWVLDQHGDYTESPDEVVSLAPLGGYKGQGLAMMVQILSCVLSGMPLDHELEHLDTGRFDTGRQIGHFMIAIDVGAFIEPARFQSEVARLMDAVRATPARDGQQVLVAGDPQERIRATRLSDGIPASDEETEVLLREAKHLNLPELNELLHLTEEA
ncbi:Ldh family oxidoreductase [Burkholderia sp. 22PA0099]|uniref:Ldh family oxidoreductase n=1 Tax=Burkholderia sp. 22PA0099 TaxID=3237372 RepID=UPI0039C2EF44